MLICPNVTRLGCRELENIHVSGTNPPEKGGTISPKAQLAPEEDAVHGQGKLELKRSQCMPSSGCKELSSELKCFG